VSAAARKARVRVIGVADMACSDDPAEELVTYALGSCLAVCVYDPVVRVGGLLHFMLPRSCCPQDRSRSNPLTFADTGVPLLFEQIYALGGVKENLVLKIAGGAAVNDPAEYFRIGDRNFEILRQMFRELELRIASADVGGDYYRTVRLRLGDGRVLITSSSGSWLI
jgi:chemotaxis protein CheD